MWKIAEVFPVTKPAKENILDPSKYRPISLLIWEARYWINYSLTESVITYTNTNY
jgi:hypothetical protein